MMLLEKAIFETIVYFDIFDYPLRANEIHKWLWRSGADFEEVISTLQTGEFLRGKLSSSDGFFFLKNRGGIVEGRLKRYRFAEKKFKKAKKVVWFLSRLPGILGIAVCNDLGYGNSPEEGDIDLFVVTKKNRVWTVRFLVTLFLKIFRLRPGETKEDAVCPSFFVDENHLNLKNLAATSPPEDDIHFVYWINQMTPVFSKDNIWQKFYKANQWTKNSLPNNYFFITNPVREVKSAVIWFRKPRCSVSETTPGFRNRTDETEQRFSLFGDWLENFLKFRFLSKEIRAVMNKDNNVVIRDGILKLHANDRRKEYYDKFYYKRISLMGSLGSPRELH